MVSIAGCDGGRTPTAPDGTLDAPYRVSGSVRVENGTPPAPGERVVVAWLVSSGSPDYVYVFGRGSIDSTGRRFMIVFDRTPPRDVLNNGRFGVGTVLFVKNDSVPDGRVADDLPAALIRGATTRGGVIFLATPPEQAGTTWLRSFQRGYNVGRGIPQPNSSFEGFAPAAPDALELIIDRIENLRFVNWT